MVRLTFCFVMFLLIAVFTLPSAAIAQFAQFAPASFAPGSTAFDSAVLESAFHPEAEAPLTSIAQGLSIPAPVADIALGGSMFSLSGKRPINLGVKEGKLTACPNTPNCVSSQSPTADKEHYIAPIKFSKSSTEAMTALKAIVEETPRTKIVTATPTYLYAEFTSTIMGFVDDVEFFVDEGAKNIHVRSASRLGQSDIGVNRKRVEEIRAKFAKLA